jgi:hypothetical protein
LSSNNGTLGGKDVRIRVDNAKEESRSTINACSLPFSDTLANYLIKLPTVETLCESGLVKANCLRVPEQRFGSKTILILTGRRAMAAATT